MMQRDEEIATRYKRGKAKAIGAIAQGLINKARSGDTTAMIFFLKTQAGWRETSTIEHFLPDEAEPNDRPSRQHLTAILDAIAARHAANDERVLSQPVLSHAESSPAQATRSADQVQ